jgi:hypothetical protein
MVIEMRFRKDVLILALTILTLVGVPAFFGVLPNTQPFGLILDVDYIDAGPYEGNYLITDEPGATIIVSPELEEIWRCTLPRPFVHESEFLPNGNVMIADTGGHRVIEVDINDPTNIVWEWNAKNPDHVNWTELAIQEGWSARARRYLSRPNAQDWTHLNDFEFINGSELGRDHDSIMVSLRNFDLIVEVNYTESREIVWHYGEPKNHTILFEQHNPDRRDNGNVIICDSENHRIIEVDYNTKEVVWQFKLSFPNGQLRWARDCDDLGDGTYLITDSNNARVLLIGRDNKTILREYGSAWLVQPYESDFYEIDGSRYVVTGDPIITSVTIMDFETGALVASLGTPFMTHFVRYFGILVNVYYVFMLGLAYKRSEREGILNRIRDPKVYRELIHVLMVYFIVVFLATFFAYLAESGLHTIIDDIVANQ